MRAKSPARSVHQSIELEARRRPARPRRRGRRNLALISVRSSSPVGEVDGRGRAPAMCTVWAPLRAQPHLDPLVVGRPSGPRARSASRSKSAPSSRLSTRSTLRLNVGGDAGGVVVGRHEPARGPSPGRCRAGGRRPAAMRVGQLGEERAPARRDAGCRWCRRGRRPGGGPPRGQLAEVALEVADDARATSTPGYSRERWRAASRSVASLTSKGTNRLQRAGRRKRVEQQPGLVRRARAQLDEGVGAAGRGDVAGLGARGSRARRGSGSTRAAG